MSQCCGSQGIGDRHDWNCVLTPIYAQAYWEADPTPVMMRREQ